jgi:hypothetical protein
MGVMPSDTQARAAEREEETDPNWPRQAIAAVVGELVAWLRALLAVTRAPRRFAADWANGRTRVLNPLAFALNELAVVGPVHALCAHLFGMTVELPLWLQAAKVVLLWLYTLAWVAPLHLALRALGGTRPLRTTLGAAIYGGGPATILRLITMPVMLRIMTRPSLGGALAMLVLSLVELLVVAIYMTAAIAGAHGVRSWRAAVPLVIMLCASSALWGWIGVRAGQAGFKLVLALVT